MKLPRGITGFRASDAEPLPETDLRAFRGHCHEAARRVGGWVVSVEPPDAGRSHNFAIATLATPAGDVAVLLNVRHPVIGFADPPAEGEARLRFRDFPELAEAFRGFGMYEVLGAAELGQAPTREQLRELSEVEREQIAYWKPRRVGDIIFNWWD